MKTLTAIMIICTIIGCGGSSNPTEPIDLSGNYELLQTECPGDFDDIYVVTQDETSLSFAPADPSFPTMSGFVAPSGEFSANTVSIACDGQADGDLLEIICTPHGGSSCQLSYQKL